MDDLCPVCFGDPELDGDLLKTAEEFAAGIPENQRADADVYAARLAACSACEWLFSRGVCARCGCFVVVRAARKNKSCPLSLDKWAADKVSQTR